MLEKKFILIVLTLSSLFITMCMVNETYGKYVTVATSTTQSSIARWKILVNNDDITLGSTTSSLITPVFPGSSDISPDVIAPNAIGYFDLVLDASNVDVSFSYEIEVKPNVNSPVSELVATKYIINGSEEIEFDSTKKITGEVRLSHASDPINIRVYVKWDDDLALMTNAEDTDTTVGNQKGLLDVTIRVTQI